MPQLNTDVIPLVVGLSLCGASAALLYIWFQTKDDPTTSRSSGDDQCDAPPAPEASTSTSTTTTRLRRISRQISDTVSAAQQLVQQHQQQQAATASASARQSHIECVIPNDIVPLVVGRGGANARAIESQSGCRITFRPRDSDTQFCVISGPSAGAVQTAAELVRKVATPPPLVSDVLRVPQSACALIVGRGGEALQEICRRSMAKVYVDAGDRSGSGSGVTGGTEAMRSIRITGTRAHVQMARTMIEEKVRDTAEQRRQCSEAELRREPRGAKHNGGSPVAGRRLSGGGDGATVLSSENGHSNGDETNAVNALPHPQPPTSPHCVSLPMNGDAGDGGGQLDVYVSAIASPSRFWLQLVGPQSQRLDAMVAEMSDYYGDAENRALHKIADPYLGQIVAALFKYDGKWYRAEIVGILPNEYNPRNVVLDLYFVDFGDSEYVAPHEVYELRTDFLTLRFQAIECFLANVKSTVKTEPEVWSPDAISRFEEVTQVAQWKKMHARIVTTKERKYGDVVRRESSPVPGVELFDSNDINIATMLVQENFALENVHTVIPAAAASSGKSAISPSSSSRTAIIVNEDSGSNSSSNNSSTKNSTTNLIDSLAAAASNGAPTNPTESFIEIEKRQMLLNNNPTT